MRHFSLLLLLVFALLVNGHSVAMSFDVEMDQQILQQALSLAFPVQRNESFVTVQLANPRVILKEGSDRIGVKSRATVEVAGGARFAGEATIDGKLRYSPKQNALYLDQATVRELHIPGVAPAVRGEVKRIANYLVRGILDSQPVYVFQKDQSANFVNKRVTGMTVKNGKLVVEFSVL